MISTPLATQSSAAHPACMALALSLFGWSLLETWLVAAGAAVAAHAIVALPGFLLTALSIRWIRRLPMPYSLSRLELSTSGLGAALLLLAVGGCLGGLTSSGLIFPLLAAAIGINFLPLWTLRLCQRHVFFSCAIVWCGAGVVVATFHRSLSLMTLPLGAWAVWCGACFSLLLAAGGSGRAGSAIVT